MSKLIEMVTRKKLAHARLDEEAAAGAAAAAEKKPSPPTKKAATWAERKALLRQVLPFLWPNEFKLQVRVLCSALVIIAARVINLYVPIFYKNCVNALTPASPPTSSGGDQTFPAGTPAPSNIYVPYAMLGLYAGFKILQGSQRDIRTLVWLPVGQYTRRAVALRVFRHLHALSLKFHLHRRTGEVLRVIERGVSSIETLLNIFVFNVAPTLTDVLIVCFVFLGNNEPLFALIIFTTIGMYMAFTFFITEWRTRFRRDMNDADNKTNDTAVDSLLNFETVKYFGAEEFEAGHYEENIRKFQKASMMSEVTLALLDVGQAVILNAGLAVGMLISAQRVAAGDMNVGDFVMVNTYIIQLATPLNWLGTSYRMIQQAFIDMEKMIELLNTHPEIQDVPGAPPVNITRGEVVFDNVSFSYDQIVPVLKGLSFKIPPGHTVAFVGATGAGKSTISRILFRFYDADEGTVLVDGQNITQVQQISLRQAIGVVPQDTVLFNNTIKYNIAYGKFGATDDEVIEAAKQAQIHQRIMSFPEGYDTKVGERGLRLSGGEKQRVAIARTILKNPRVVILDEATSALDTVTERQIQDALATVTTGRSTMVIAHRLSTVVGANEIIVLKDGCVAERGSHEQLLSMDGEYAKLWWEQARERQDLTGSATGTPKAAAGPAVL